MYYTRTSSRCWFILNHAQCIALQIYMFFKCKNLRKTHFVNNFFRENFFFFSFLLFSFSFFVHFLSFSFFFFSFVFFKKCTIFVSTLELVGRWLFYFTLNPLVFSIQSNHTIIPGGFFKNYVWNYGQF